MTTLADRHLIPKELKKTTKYTDEQREQVKRLYKKGKSIHTISKIIPMSRRMVQFTLFPERMKHNAELFAQRQKTGIYRYPTPIQSAMVKKVRHRKRKMLSLLIKKQ